MKKIILLVITSFFLTGCFDYVELNELSVITMVIVDKKDNNYNIAFEILNDKKDKDNSQVNKSIIVRGSGKTISAAINNTISKTPKLAYLAHLKVLAISKNVARNNLKEIIEFFLRNPNVRNEFYLTIVNNDNPFDILNINKDEMPIASDVISSVLKDNKRTTNNITNSNFENIIIDIFKKGKDATIPIIKYENDIKAYGTALLSNYKLKEILNSNEASLLNILLNNTSNTSFTFQCPTSKDMITLKIYSGKTSTRIKKQEVEINTNLMAEISEYQCQDDLRDTNTFKKYNKYYEKKFNENIKNLYTKLQNNKTDSLGIGKELYIKRRYYKEDNWLYLNPIIKSNLKINKEGLIYEVNNEN